MHILHTQQLGNPFWNYIVLCSCIIFEGTSFIIAAKEFNKVRGDFSWWQAIKRSKDPSSFAVLFKDGAAVLGLCIVIICVYLGHRFTIPYYLLVGLLLVAASIILACESRSLLMGEGIEKTTQQKIISITESDPSAVKMMKVFSSYQSPENVFLILCVQFKKALRTEEIDHAINRIGNAIRKDFVLISYVIIQPEFVE